jgi:hypothetical protein
MQQSLSRHRGVVAADLVISLFIILFIASFAVCGVVDELETNARVKCASNLRQIGQAILMYANENKQQYPRTIYKPADPPTWGSGPEAPSQADPFAKDTPLAHNDVTAALFLLLRTQDITSGAFVCPSTNVDPWDFGGGVNTAQNWVNWPKSILAKHLSYSYQNPYPSTAAVRAGFRLHSSLPADFAVLADINPGTPELTTLTVDSPPEQIRLGNSPNHNQDGQNVLFGDGHVDFMNNPFCGRQRDNIYTSNTKTADGKIAVIDSPADGNDSVLLPTADGQKYDRQAAVRHMGSTPARLFNGANGGIAPLIVFQLMNREFSAEKMNLHFVNFTTVDVTYSKTPGEIIAATCTPVPNDRLRLTIMEGGTAHVVYFTIAYTTNAADPQRQIDHLVQESDGTIFDSVKK